MYKIVGDYQLVEKIGKGNFADVYLGINQKTTQKYAIKVIAKETFHEPKLMSGLEYEIKIMKEFSHVNIVQLYKYFSSEKNFYLVVEYCAGGDLNKFIKKSTRLSETLSINFLSQLTEGLFFLHEKGFIHRDLKPANVLLSDNSNNGENAILKLADFGFARHLGSSTLAQTRCGTPLYMAPEILEARDYDGKADVWSLGCIFYEMLVGTCPFKGTNEADLLNNIRTLSLKIPSGIEVSKASIGILIKLLEKVSSRRASIEQLAAITRRLKAEAEAITKKSAAANAETSDVSNVGDSDASSAGNLKGPTTESLEPSPQAGQNPAVNIPPPISTGTAPIQSLGASSSGNFANPGGNPSNVSASATISTRRPRGDSLGSDPVPQQAGGSHSIPIPIPSSNQMSPQPQGYLQQHNNMTSPGSYTNPNAIMANMMMFNHNNNNTNNNHFNSAGGPGDKMVAESPIVYTMDDYYPGASNSSAGSLTKNNVYTNHTNQFNSTNIGGGGGGSEKRRSSYRSSPLATTAPSGPISGNGSDKIRTSSSEGKNPFALPPPSSNAYSGNPFAVPPNNNNVNPFSQTFPGANVVSSNSHQIDASYSATFYNGVNGGLASAIGAPSNHGCSVNNSSSNNSGHSGNSGNSGTNSSGTAGNNEDDFVVIDNYFGQQSSMSNGPGGPGAAPYSTNITSSSKNRNSPAQTARGSTAVGQPSGLTSGITSALSATIQQQQQLHADGVSNHGTSNLAPNLSSSPNNFSGAPNNLSGPTFTAAAIWDYTQQQPNSNNNNVTPGSSYSGHSQIPNNFSSPQQPQHLGQYSSPASYLNQSSSSGIAITAASPNPLAPNSSVNNSSTGGSMSGGGVGEEMIIIQSLVAKCENYCEMINVITKIADLRIVQEQQLSRQFTGNTTSPATLKGSAGQSHGQSRAWKDSIESYVCACSLYLHALLLLKNLLASLSSYSTTPSSTMSDQNQIGSNNSVVYPLVVRMKTDLSQMFDQLLFRVENCQISLQSLISAYNQSNPHQNTSYQKINMPKAEQLMLQEAVRYENEANLAELVGNLQRAVNYYQLSKKLVQGVNMTYAEEDVKKVRNQLKSFQDMIDQKLSICLMKLKEMKALGYEDIHLEDDFQNNSTTNATNTTTNLQNHMNSIQQQLQEQAQQQPLA